MSLLRRHATRLIPIAIIAALLLAFSSSGGNLSTCGGACFLPDEPVVAARH